MNTPRETIVKYFREDVSAAVAEEECCDMCLGQPDYQDEVLAVIKVVQEIPGYGEQKVCMC